MIPAGLLLADTSAIARIHHAPIAQELTRLGRIGLLARCITVDLEVGYSARNPDEHGTIIGLRQEGFTDLPIRPEIGDRAKSVQAMLARRGMHRSAGAFDLLTAAIAEHHGATVLHYDSDFDHIASVTGQDTKWIVPRGSVD